MSLSFVDKAELIGKSPVKTCSSYLESCSPLKTRPERCLASKPCIWLAVVLAVSLGLCKTKMKGINTLGSDRLSELRYNEEYSHTDHNRGHICQINPLQQRPTGKAEKMKMEMYKYEMNMTWPNVQKINN